MLLLLILLTIGRPSAYYNHKNPPRLQWTAHRGTGQGHLPHPRSKPLLHHRLHKPNRGRCDQWTATAYCLPGRTASGIRGRRGIVAASLPLGTWIRVNAPGYTGLYVVMDRGVRGRRIDIWMNSYKEARLFGRRRVWVTVYTKSLPSTYVRDSL